MVDYFDDFYDVFYDDFYQYEFIVSPSYWDVELFHQTIELFNATVET